MAKFSDGSSLSVGSVELTIDTVPYVAEDFTINKTSETIELRDEDGEPTQAVIYTNVPTFSATIQFAASTTAAIEVGDTFVIASGDAAGTWLIESVGTTLGQRAFKKASISGRKKINV